jgi:hypothetical protein
MKVNYNPFGYNVHDAGLTHYKSMWGNYTICKRSFMNEPPLCVDVREPVTCLTCLAMGDEHAERPASR